MPKPNRRRYVEEENDESEEEVLSVGGGDDSSDDDGSDIALSDVEGQEQDDDDLPDIRAWGQGKKNYYNTDYLDPDFGGFQGKDAAQAETEEEGGKNIRELAFQQLITDEFSVKRSSKKFEEDERTDFSKMSKKEQRKLEKELSADFMLLVEEYKANVRYAGVELGELIDYYKKGKIEDCPALQFAVYYHELILLYCSNIGMHLVLSTSQVDVKAHPIEGRIAQLKELLTQLQPVFEEKIKPQIPLMLESIKNTDKPEKPKKKKILNILSAMDASENKKNKKKRKSEEDVKKVEKKKVRMEIGGEDEQEEECEEDKMEGATIDEEYTDENTKRSITYQIAKNKGLTPYRKKELRNPRVKHRNKYRKATIRRKGAVRDVRREVKRYAGEMSGINPSVIKSIRIK